MTNSKSLVAALILVSTLAAPVVAQERPVAGRIKVSTGAAFIVRDGAQIPASSGRTYSSRTAFEQAATERSA
jgi:hypothetical protein